MRRALAAVLALALAGVAAAQETPVDPIDVKPEDLAQPPAPDPSPSPTAAPSNMTLSMLAGGMASLSSGADATATPVVRIAIEASLADYERPPRLMVFADLGALPGEALDASQADTFRSVEMSGGLAWQPAKGWRFSLYAYGGFATRLPSDPEPLERTARWFSFGVRFADHSGNILEVGAGPDQRLDGTYRTVGHVTGAVRLWEAVGQEVGLHLIGRAILGIDPTFQSDVHTAPGDVVQFGVAVTRR